MSFLDTLPPERQDEVRAAVMAVAQDNADFLAERDRLAAAQGTQAVAEAAWFPGRDETRRGTGAA